MSRRLDDVRLAALLLDGIELKGRCCVVALGISTDGVTVPLGLWDGSTENKTVARHLLSDLVGRGLDVEQGVLVVLDGGKALRAAVVEVFGPVAATASSATAAAAAVNYASATTKGQEEQLTAVGLVVNAIVLYNMDLHQARSRSPVRPRHQTGHEEIQRLSPLASEHSNLTGRYHLTLPDNIRHGEYRPLKITDDTDAAIA